MTIEERLETLEKELSRANRRNRSLLAGVALCIGIAFVAWIFRPQTLLAQNAANPLTEVHANRFVLEDEKGKTRAVLGSDKDATALRLYDEKGKARAALALAKDGPALALCDEKGTPRVMLDSHKDGPSLKLADEKGTERAGLGANNTITPDGKAITYPESSLLLYNPDGNVRWKAP